MLSDFFSFFILLSKFSYHQYYKDYIFYYFIMLLFSAIFLSSLPSAFPPSLPSLLLSVYFWWQLGLCGCWWASANCGERGPPFVGGRGLSLRGGASLVAEQRLEAHRLQQLRLMGWAAPRHVRSSCSRDRTHVPCVSRRIVNHWSNRETPSSDY